MARRPSPAVFISKELEDFLKRLRPDDKRKRWIDDMVSVLKENMFAGHLTDKNRIPKYYRRRCRVDNLSVYDHPEGYRSCYSIDNRDGLGACPTIWDLMSHPEYEKRFGYKKG